MPEIKTGYAHYSDEGLFELVKQEDRKAFEELYGRHWTLLLDGAYKVLKSQHKAEDVVQEIFISLYQRRHLVDFSVSLKAYLLQALKFKIMNEFRSQFTRASYQKASLLNSHCKNDFTSKLEAKELQQKLHREIQELPEKCKQAFLLSREEDLSYKDISRGLGISVSTVEKHISKALRILKVNMAS